MIKQLKTTCIMCPMGCALTVREDESGEVSVSGNTCKRGVPYGKQELSAPMRVVTSVVKVKGGGVLSVKTAEPVPKGKIFDVLEQLKTFSAPEDTAIGDVLIENTAGTGASIVATSSPFEGA